MSVSDTTNILYCDHFRQIVKFNKIIREEFEINTICKYLFEIINEYIECDILVTGFTHYEPEFLTKAIYITKNELLEISIHDRKKLSELLQDKIKIESNDITDSKIIDFSNIEIPISIFQNKVIEIFDIFFNKITYGNIIIISKNQHRMVIDSHISDLINVFCDSMSFVFAIEQSISVKNTITKKLIQENKVKLLEKALYKEKQYISLYQNFMDLSSHEFKTPISIIATSNTLMKVKMSKFIERIKNQEHNILEIAEEFNNQSELFFEKIFRNIKRIEVLLDSINRLSMVEHSNTNAICSKLFSLNNMLTEMIGYYTNAHPDFIIELELDDITSSILGDEKIIDHIVSNIISNAMKFSIDKKHI